MYEEDEVEIPIYLITGFLESGKTSFINFTVAQDYFQIDGPTLLITTEEGEVEYDEKELLKHIVNGLTNNEIAEKMFLGVETVNSYRKNLLLKLGAKNTAVLVRMAVEEKLV